MWSLVIVFSFDIDKQTPLWVFTLLAVSVHVALLWKTEPYARKTQGWTIFSFKINGAIRISLSLIGLTNHRKELRGILFFNSTQTPTLALGVSCNFFLCGVYHIDPFLFLACIFLDAFDITGSDRCVAVKSVGLLLQFFFRFVIIQTV